jgi:putative membrane protein
VAADHHAKAAYAASSAASSENLHETTTATDEPMPHGDGREKEMRTVMWNYGMGWGGWLLMSLAMVAFWAIVVFGVVALFRGFGTPGPGADRRRGEDAQRVLDERFARGEIDQQEYLARTDVMRSAAAKR